MEFQSSSLAGSGSAVKSTSKPVSTIPFSLDLNTTVSVVPVDLSHSVVLVRLVFSSDWVGEKASRSSKRIGG